MNNLKPGDLIHCIENGEAFDGGNRVFKGSIYEVVEAIYPGDFTKGYNAETLNGGLIVKNPGENPRPYPYLWRFDRFEVFED